VDGILQGGTNTIFWAELGVSLALSNMPASPPPPKQHGAGMVHRVLQ
jgi:hypothetical protein